LTILAWISLATAFVCAGLIVADIFVRGYRQHMWIMDVVWPLTALYSGPLGWLAYHWGRLNSPRYRRRTRAREHHPFSVSVRISDTHCGAGCALGDLIAEWVLFAVGVAIAGVALWPEYLADSTLAFAFASPRCAVSPRVSDFNAAITPILTASSPEAGPCRVLVSHAGRDDPRLPHLLSRDWLADPPRDQGRNVTGDPARLDSLKDRRCGVKRWPG
jgi:hypothetical protein